MENNYSNIIAPSDGVRRFLCKTSVLMVSLFSVVYCVFAFRMNMLEAGTLGGTLRSRMLYAAYIMLPLGLITSAVFARIRAMGLAFSMISLLVATAAALMLLLNSLASLMREGRLLGVSGSLLEFLTFAAFFALLVNLVMSCMDFKLLPVIGVIGSVAGVCALTVTSVRTMLSFSALSFAWKSEFQWKNIGELIDTDKLRYHAAWIFRSIPHGNAKAMQAMFDMRLYERISACLFYAMLIMIFLKFHKEMKAFNKLLVHASEYVDIPTARIYQTIFGSGARNDGEPVVKKPKRAGGSLRRRLRELNQMVRAKEQGEDITDLADSYDAEREEDNREDEFWGENGEEEERRSAPTDEELTEEERYIMEMRRRRGRPSSNGDERPERRRRDEFGNERPERRRRDEFGNERPERRRRDEFGNERPERRRRDEFGNERPERRRRDEFGNERPERRRRDEFGNERPERRRRDEFGDERRNPRRQPERELTDQEKYLMEERRRRQQKMQPDGAGNRQRRSGEREYDRYGESGEKRRRYDEFHQ